MGMIDKIQPTLDELDDALDIVARWDAERANKRA